eukprot:CAMPEP_0205909184 /NCGR_PEP_ID=MMETSP1325-20131115/3708_1 /ASSEMBLY_ACC=CAM_ASM_000708 /TAXON_ID=236786 /ORGANISM="Florenciella sp., Strain RCC1007" /LENGTH=226 /DNA_ID=CAMNT_0053275455 /DNA_START=18 /DNA_END=698 /DNA_ORIENTATION=-
MGCRDCCSGLFKSLLTIFNFVDFSCGAVFIGYGCWVHSKVAEVDDDDATATGFWIMPVVVGTILVITALLSFLGLTFDVCRCGLCVSAWLAVPIALLQFSTAIYLLVSKDTFWDYLEDHEKSMGIDDDTISGMQSFFNVIVVGLFGLGVMQGLRFAMSKKLRNYMHLSKEEFERALEQEATDFEIHRAEQRAETQSKYNAKRAMYREKYAGIAGVGTETLLDREDA